MVARKLTPQGVSFVFTCIRVVTGIITVRTVELYYWFKISRLLTDFIGFPEPEISDLMNYVGAAIPHMWMEVGEGLQVKEGALQGIQAEHAAMPNGQQHCFRAVLSKWHNGLTSEYSWQHLVEVLQSPSVNQHRLVQDLYGDLSKKYPTR